MALTRTTHWATRELNDFLLARARMPFRWGVNDCCLMPADAIWAFTGVDLAAPFRANGSRRTKAGIKRGRYADEVSALAAIRDVAGSCEDPALAVGRAAEFCADQAGLEELKFVKCAQRGDLLVMEDSGRLIAGIVHLNGREGLSVGANGLMKLPMESWRRAWRV